MSVTYCYEVPDVVCANCASTILNVLDNSAFAQTSQYVIEAKKLYITFDETTLSEEEVCLLLNNALENVGFFCKTISKDWQAERQKIQRAHLFQAVAGLLFGVSLMFAMMFGALSMTAMFWTTLFTIPATIGLGFEFYQSAWRKLLKGQLTMDTLFSVSTIILMSATVASFWFPVLPMMSEVGLMLFGFRHLGRWIEERYSIDHAAYSKFRNKDPEKVRIQKNGRIDEIDFDKVKVGDLILLNQHDMLPVDGFFVAGEGAIETSIITGSKLSHPLEHAQMYYAGSYVTHGQGLIYQVVHEPAQSHLAKLDISIANAKLSQRSRTQTSTVWIMQYFIPIILFISAFSGLVVGYFCTPALAIQCAVSVLVSACPCTLGLIAPLLVNIGLKKSTEASVIFKNVNHMESLAQASAIVFDLNGVLTCGKPKVLAYHSLLDTLSDDAFLAQLAYFEKDATHLVAKAIVERASSLSSFTIDNTSLQITEKVGGRICQYGDANYLLGGESFMLAQGLSSAELSLVRQHAMLKNQQCSLVYLVKVGGLGEKSIQGYVVVQDALRPEAKQIVHTFKKMGKEVYIATGENPQTAEYFANQLDISRENVYANCVAHHDDPNSKKKRALLDKLHADNHIIVAIGDANNDVEMLTLADVSFTFSDIAEIQLKQQASAVIYQNSLWPLLHAVQIASQVSGRIRQNLILSLLYNVISVILSSGLSLCVGIIVHPAVGAGLMILQTGLILWDALNFERQSVILPEALHFEEHTDDSMNRMVQELSVTAPLVNPKPQIERNYKGLFATSKKDDQTSCSIELRI